MINELKWFLGGRRAFSRCHSHGDSRVATSCRDEMGSQYLAHLVFVDPLKSMATITEPKSIKMGPQVFIVLGIQWLKVERLPVPKRCYQRVFSIQWTNS